MPTVVNPSSGGTTPEYPWLVQIKPVQGRTVVAGTWANQFDNTVIFSSYAFNSTAAQNDELTFPVLLSAGTWTCELLVVTNNNAGIVTVSLGGSSVGTIDTYSASAVVNVVGSIAGIAVATSGKTLLSLKMATKNASSTAYRGNLQSISMLRTA